jgi:predicted nucleic acid-binding protein
MLSRRVLQKELTPEDSDMLFKAFQYARGHVFHTADSPQAEEYDFAAQAIRRHETGLRAGDALHIAIARKLTQDHGDITLITFDARLARVAPLFGIPATIPA